MESHCRNLAKCRYYFQVGKQILVISLRRSYYPDSLESTAALKDTTAAAI